MTSARRPGSASRNPSSDPVVRPARRRAGRSEPTQHDPSRVPVPAGPVDDRTTDEGPTDERPPLRRAPLRRQASVADSTDSGDTSDVVLTGAERDRYASHELFRRLQACVPGSPEWRTHRDELVRRHLPLAHYLVRRFAGRGEPMDDLIQVATIGLIKAVDRFDLERGVEFSTYATPTVVGEVKRHFRDRGWAIRVPRRMQEHTLAVSRATGDLFGRLSRSPTIAELAGYTQLTEEEVLEAIGSAHAYTTVSLDVELADDSPGGAAHPAAGDAQAALENVEHRASLRPLLSRLTPRERQILALRFFANMTQSEIAAEIGVSQMHVSRLLSRTLAHLREGLGHAE
ncbi:SigB/SigF/SigG family RNA polymerase sigma factor [Cryptosporangium minutisporangium]|uniref:RNA polymerase sigma factor SigF n=1 Tax=Cryptosporangium minutisporangium TaxID=113569 RepID=A0ABP6T9T7_9ACTN